MIVLSASQIKTFRLCQRKWALEKIAGHRGPETKSQALGKDVDDNQLQPYLRDGKPFDFTRESGYIAASGLAWLPQPKWKGLEVQKHFQIVSPSSKSLGIEFGYQGYLDLWLPNGGQPGFENDLPTVGDFKTTKAKKWALTVDGLKEDVQSQLYAVWALLETGSKEINLSWLYLLTDGTRKSFPIQTTVHTDEVAEEFKKIEETSRDLVQIRRKMPKGADPQEYAMSVPGNKDACGAYGGCPFQHFCFTLDDLIDEPVCAGVIGGSQAERNRLYVPTGVKGEEKVMDTIDLFAKLNKKKQAAPAVGAAQEPAVGAASVAQEPPTQEQIAAEPALGINPPMPEGTPLAPPVGDGKKRGRPKGSVNKAKTGPDLVEKMQANAGQPYEEAMASVQAPPPPGDAPSTFDETWTNLGGALKAFLAVVGVKA